MAAASTACTPRPRRSRKKAASVATWTVVDSRQLSIPEVVQAAPDFTAGPPETAALVVQGPVARLALSKVTWVFDRRAAEVPLPLETALAIGTRALPEKPGHVAKAETGPEVEYGLQTPELHEYFLTKGGGMQGVVLLRRKESGEWNASVGKTLVPYVLSEEAIEKDVMPPHGMSALPKSLERVIPPAYRFWDYPENEACAVRNALAESGLFAPDLVKMVDGELRLCVRRLFLFEPDGTEKRAPVAPSSFADVFPELLGEELAKYERCSPLIAQSVESPFSWQDRVASIAKRTDALMLLSPGEGFDTKAVVDTVVKAAPTSAWMLDHADTTENRAELGRLGRVFKVNPVAEQDRIFVASFCPPDTLVTFVVGAVAPPAPDLALVQQNLQRLADVSKRELKRVLKAEETEDERYVLGIVLEPETVDAQKDIYSPAEVRRTAHTFMQDYRTIGLMHKGAINDKVKILESFIAPSDFEVNGVPVKAGTWLMGVRVQDDALWKAVKDGELTGFSIGGSALRKPDADATTQPSTQAN